MIEPTHLAEGDQIVALERALEVAKDMQLLRRTITKQMRRTAIERLLERMEIEEGRWAWQPNTTAIRSARARS